MSKYQDYDKVGAKALVGASRGWDWAGICFSLKTFLVSSAVFEENFEVLS